MNGTAIKGLVALVLTGTLVWGSSADSCRPGS